jgi:hypothetical protein
VPKIESRSKSTMLNKITERTSEAGIKSGINYTSGDDRSSIAEYPNYKDFQIVHKLEIDKTKLI